MGKEGKRRRNIGTGDIKVVCEKCGKLGVLG